MMMVKAVALMFLSSSCCAGKTMGDLAKRKNISRLRR